MLPGVGRVSVELSAGVHGYCARSPCLTLAGARRDNVMEAKRD